MQLVLAIEPDLRQAAIIKRIVRDKVLADVIVVETRDAALDAIRKQIPDVLLLSALLSPRDEDELMAHLRLLDGADHLQTHTIPQLAGTSADREGGRSRGLFGIFGKKKDKEDAPAAGCDPDLFGEEIRTYLQRAHEKKEERKFLLEQGIEIETPAGVASSQSRHAEAAPAEPAEESGSSSSWSSPFEWRPKSAAASQARVADPESAVASPESLAARDDDDAASEPEGPRPEPSILRDEPSIIRDEPSVSLPEPPTLSAETQEEAPEPVYEAPTAPVYESVILPEPIAPEPEPLVSHDPIAAKPADPWTVEYGGGHHVLPQEPSMVGYTAPFAAPPTEPIALSKSAMSPDIEPVEHRDESTYEPLIHTQPEIEEETPLVMRTRAAEEQDLSRISDALDLQVEETSTTIDAGVGLDADEPVIEISARDVLPDRETHAISIDDLPEASWHSDLAPREIPEPTPVAAAPPMRRSKPGASSSVLRLMPLAIWARAEMDKPGKPAAPPEDAPRTVNDELRDLMSRLALPPNIAGVSYARGVRIRRVRVQGSGNPADDGAPGPVILSKKALEERRART